MRNMLSRKATAWALAGTTSLVAAAAATAAVSGGDDPVPSVSTAERAGTAALRATQKELRSTGISVDRISLAATRDGVDYYALRGEGDHCILTAPSGQPGGPGGALGCAPNDAAKPLGLPITGADSQLVAYAFWTDGGSLSATSSDSGAPLEVTAGPTISFVELAVPGQGFNATWIPRSGERTTYPVRSAADIEREAQERHAETHGAPRR